MAKTPTNFKTETQLNTTRTVLVSADSSSVSKKVIRASSFFNKSLTSLMTVSVHRLLSSNSISDDNLIIQRDIPPRKTWNAVELQGKVIEPGFELAATATDSDTVNVEVDGVISS
jgi:hypothetical protein